MGRSVFAEHFPFSRALRKRINVVAGSRWQSIGLFGLLLQKMLTSFTVDYLNISRQAGKDHASLSAIRTQISESMADEACRQIINSTSTKQRDIGKYTRRDSERDLLITSGPAHRDPLANSGPEQYAWPLPQAPPEEDEDHRILSRWKQESIPEVVLEGSVGELMLCLCSKYMDIRRQALSALRALRDSFSVSDVS